MLPSKFWSKASTEIVTIGRDHLSQRLSPGWRSPEIAQIGERDKALALLTCSRLPPFAS
jgi:hypothetical protein